MFAKTNGPSSMDGVRRDVLLVYDRWTRTDSGGFLRTLKALVAVLEDLEIVSSFPQLFPDLARNNIVFNPNVKQRVEAVLRNKYSDALQQLEQCLVSMEKTLDYVAKLGQTNSPNSIVQQYFTNIHLTMTEMISLRKEVVKEFSKNEISSFSNHFDRISFWLVLIAETSEDYIPYYARVEGVPYTLEAIRENNGRSIFS